MYTERAVRPKRRAFRPQAFQAERGGWRDGWGSRAAQEGTRQPPGSTGSGVDGGKLKLLDLWGVRPGWNVYWLRF
jgi:hypothetical protein